MASTGLRDKLVTIQHGTITTGGSGFPIETWADAPPPVWMQRELTKGSEPWRANANTVIASAAFTFRMPYLPDMDPDLVDVPKARRLRYLGRTYDVITAERSRPDEIELVTRAQIDDLNSPGRR